MAGGFNCAGVWRLIPDSEPVEAISESEDEEDRRWLIEYAQRVIEAELEILRHSRGIGGGWDLASWVGSRWGGAPSNLQSMSLRYVGVYRFIFQVLQLLPIRFTDERLPSPMICCFRCWAQVKLTCVQFPYAWLPGHSGFYPHGNLLDSPCIL
jgi:hypothetical protein